MKNRIIFLILAILLISAIFSGCTHTVEEQRPRYTGLYTWANFETHMYDYLNNPNPSVQIHAMERDRQEIERSNRPAPPGFYAHLGYMYSEIEDHGMAVFYFEKEKAAFPEAAPFMDLLLSRYRR